MTERMQIYHCPICGNMVEVLQEGAGTLICCGQPMDLMEENTVDAAVEKHVPVVERIDGGIRVAVGSVAHPMTEEHHIAWIELTSGDTTHRRFLDPTGKPEAYFEAIDGENITVREYCNLHGIWRS